MNYAEAKAKYTTVESIDNRLKEIDELAKVGADKYTSCVTNYINEVNDVLKKFNITEYHVDIATDRHVTLKAEDNNSFYELDIYTFYEYN